MKKIIISSLLIIAFQTQALTSSVPALEDHWSAVVQITTDGLDSDKELVNSYCVATFLNPRTLITAAHCVSHAYLLSSNKIKIDIGRYEYRTRPDGSIFRLGYVIKSTIHQSARFHFNSSLTQKLRSQNYSLKISPDEDLALITLTEPVTQEMTFFKPLTDTEIRTIKKDILNYVPSLVTVNFIAEMSLDTKRAATLNQLKTSGSRSWSSKSQARVEPGDSGAPLFIRTGQDWKLIGVVKGQAKTLFSDWDVLASLESNLCEISKLHSLNICN